MSIQIFPCIRADREKSATLDAGGTTVSLQTPMGIMETKAGWILLLGFTPESSGAQLGEDFLKMIKSAK